jgi:serine/threonine protein kinase
MTTSTDRPPLVPGISDLSPLHVGGFGAVYRGYQHRSDRWVAVKVIVSKEPDAVRVRRFERECSILGEVTDQRYALRLYDSGYLHGGSPYLVTELCTGGSLAERLAQQGRRPVGEVVDVGRWIGAVLRRMHGAGLLHRDVKPGNILFRADGDPVLADFGMAMRAGGADTGPALASPGHTAPEALTERRWTPAADVFALGSTLSTALTGVLPDPWADAYEEIVHARLSALLRQMLAVEPALRPSAGEVVERLTRIASGAPVFSAEQVSAPRPPQGNSYVPPVTQRVTGPADGTPPWWGGRPGAWWRRASSRARLLGAGAAVGVLAVVAAMIVTGWPFAGRSVSRLSEAGSPIQPAAASSPDERASRAPTPSPSAPTPAAPKPTGTPGGRAGGVVPTNFHIVHAAQGLVAAVPAGWTIGAVSGTSELRAADPRKPGAFLQFGGYRPGHTTQLGRVRGYAANVRSQSRNYRQLRIAGLTFGHSPDAVDWEYIYDTAGGPRHAYGRYWRIGTAEYVAYANAPADQWGAMLRTFRVLLASARPQ